MRRFALAGVAALTLSVTGALAQKMVVRQSFQATESGEKKPEKSNEFVPDKQANPDPKSLDVPADIGAKAKAFVAQLGSGAFRDREIAQRELAKLGRLALPAMMDAITNNPEPEVALRIETLLPRAEAEDMIARVNCFLLDTESKFEHVLPGWKKFQSVAGSDKAARKIFAEALKSKQSHAMLLAAERGSTDEAGQLLSYYVAKLQGINYNNGNEDSARTPKTGELAVALFLEGQFSDKRINITMPGQWGWGGYYTVMNHIHSNTDFSNAVNGQKTENTAVIRKLMVQWMDTRETLQGLNTAFNQANSILRDQPKAALKYAAKMLTVPSGPNDYYNKQNALSSLGTQGGKEYLVQISKSFDDTNRISWGGQGNTPDVDIEIRDYALAVATQLADLKPEDFGMSRNGDAKTKLWTYNNFYFKDDRPVAERNPGGGGRMVRVRPVEEKKEDPKKEDPKKDPKKEEKLTSDDRRKIAFKKWEDWAKTGLDKDGKVIKKEEPKKEETKKEDVKKDETAKEKPMEKPAPKKDIEKSEKK